MSNTPRMNAAIAFVEEQLRTALALMQDHPYYVIDVLNKEAERLERENAELKGVLRLAYDAISVYSPDYMHGLPKKYYTKAILKALGEEVK